MAIRRVIDSNVIIYSFLRNHPAYGDCVAYLKQFDEDGVLFSTVDSLTEIYQVLRGFYGIKSAIILDYIRDLLDSRISFLNLSQEDLFGSFTLLSKSTLQVNDVKLYTITQQLQAPILVTDDRKLGDFAREHHLIHESPIKPETRKLMDAWEQEHLPQKGLPRVLKRVYLYLATHNKSLAETFQSDSGNFQRIPEQNFESN